MTTKQEKIKENKKIIGEVWVDSASLVIEDQMNFSLDDEQYTSKNGKVHCKTGFGDGCYPVIATFKYYKGGGERISKIEIIFIEDEINSLEDYFKKYNIKYKKKKIKKKS